MPAIGGVFHLKVDNGAVYIRVQCLFALHHFVDHFAHCFDIFRLRTHCFYELLYLLFLLLRGHERNVPGHCAYANQIFHGHNGIGIIGKGGNDFFESV